MDILVLEGIKIIAVHFFLMFLGILFIVTLVGIGELMLRYINVELHDLFGIPVLSWKSCNIISAIVIMVGLIIFSL